MPPGRAEQHQAGQRQWQGVAPAAPPPPHHHPGAAQCVLCPMPHRGGPSAVGLLKPLLMETCGHDRLAPPPCTWSGWEGGEGALRLAQNFSSS